MTATKLQVVDTTTHPYLSGRFAPVATEIDTTDLVVEGSLPHDLTGTYRRNGPNPKRPPLGSYTYPMEGDAMIHSVWIEAGRARYKNRWVRTKGMAAEDRAGRALFGGLMTPAFVDVALLGSDPDPGWPVRLDPFINVVRHGGRYLALEEGTPPYEITADMDTVGLWDFGGGLPSGMCAHPRVDPASGEMVIFRYDVEAPFLTLAVVAADGSVRRAPSVIEAVDQPFMVHDFTITERYAVFVLGPALLDLDALLTGGQVLRWERELGTQVVVVPREGTEPPVVASADAFWVWHFANAYERGSEIVVDFPSWSSLGLGLAGVAPPTGAFSQAVVDVSRATVSLTHLSREGSEFPRIDDRRTGQPYRYATTVGRSDRAGLVDGEHDVLIRWDMTTGGIVRHVCDAAIGEVVFAPRDGSEEELDGYYLTFGTSLEDNRSWLYVWDAGEFPGEPRARVSIPQRVPNGLHGNWFPAR